MCTKDLKAIYHLIKYIYVYYINIHQQFLYHISSDSGSDEMFPKFEDIQILGEM